MFINIPNNYSSMWGELTFEYNSTLDSDIVITVKDEITEEVVAVKKFYSSTDAKINVAPILFDTMLPTATKMDSGVTTPTVGFPKISVLAGSDTTDTLTFTYAREAVEPPIVLTTMSSNRLLYPNESDSITVLVAAGATIKSYIEGTPLSEQSAPLYATTISSVDGGVRVITINADDYNDEYSALKVILYADDIAFGEINYTLSSDSAPGYRVAWISSMGSIEHYTFPIIEEQVRMSSGATTISLRSAYGTAQEIDALGDIITSPTIWRVTSQDYTTVELLTTELATRQSGSLTIANIKLSENG